GVEVHHAALEALIDEAGVARVGGRGGDGRTPDFERDQAEDGGVAGAGRARIHRGEEGVLEPHRLALPGVGGVGADEVEDRGRVVRSIYAWRGALELRAGLGEDAAVDTRVGEDVRVEQVHEPDGVAA